ncbi:hypothetical protein C7999DRAFT_16677 [Corynascus novoguineensis]|uniref:Uncharacterized protein n=1 Tax=Corynascus novoguineensis TaxID=1126955 RepID=A0AAN7HCU7_9PEZI|nr:hypothetical protein C7999DRAFT_16677 [Corynascus novoguineensis]
MWFSKPVLRAALTVGFLLQRSSNATPTLFRRTLSPIPVRQISSVCEHGAIVPDLWLVDGLNVKYTNDEQAQPGNASWTLTNTLTNVTEHINCPLRLNYICDMNGTPKDSGLHIWLQINLNIAALSFNQTLPCGNETTAMSAYAIGNANVRLVCEEENTSCSGSGDGGIFVDGSVSVVSIAP